MILSSLFSPPRWSFLCGRLCFETGKPGHQCWDISVNYGDIIKRESSSWKQLSHPQNSSLREEEESLFSFLRHSLEKGHEDLNPPTYRIHTSVRTYTPHYTSPILVRGRRCGVTTCESDTLYSSSSQSQELNASIIEFDGKSSSTCGFFWKAWYLIMFFVRVLLLSRTLHKLLHSGWRKCGRAGILAARGAVCV